jgi:hypothetical protein
MLEFFFTPEGNQLDKPLDLQKTFFQNAQTSDQPHTRELVCDPGTKPKLPWDTYTYVLTLPAYAEGFELILKWLESDSQAVCLADFEASPFKKVPRCAGAELRGLVPNLWLIRVVNVTQDFQRLGRWPSRSVYDARVPSDGAAGWNGAQLNRNHQLLTIALMYSCSRDIQIGNLMAGRLWKA